MTQSVFQVLVTDPLADITSAALGAAAGEGWKDLDRNKAVKLGAANNYELCAAADEIEGVVSSVEPYTVNDGFSFGGVRTNKRVEAVLDTGETVGIPGALVVAGTQAAVGTAGGLVVRVGTPATFKWRIIRLISGTGVAGDKVLIERI